MNIECMYMLHPEDQTIENYFKLAQMLDGKGNFERTPVAISIITKKVKVFSDVNVQGGWVSGKSDVLQPGNIVLFVQGKLHHMGTYAYSFLKPAITLFPESGTMFFKDIISITGDLNYDEALCKTKMPSAPKIKDMDKAIGTYKHMYDMIAELPPDDFAFTGKRCTLFGKFSFGSKKEVEEYIKSCGGMVAPMGFETDILIIGDKARYNCCDYGGRGEAIEVAVGLDSVHIYEERYVLTKDK